MMNEINEKGILGERLVETVKEAGGKYNTTQMVIISFACGVMLGLFIGYAFL